MGNFCLISQKTLDMTRGMWYYTVEVLKASGLIKNLEMKTMPHTDRNEKTSKEKSSSDTFSFKFFSHTLLVYKKQLSIWFFALVISLAPLLVIDYFRYIRIDTPSFGFWQFFFQNEELLFVYISFIAASAVEELSSLKPRFVLLMGMLIIIIVLALAYGVLKWISYESEIDFSIVNASVIIFFTSFLMGCVPFIKKE